MDSSTDARVPARVDLGRSAVARYIQLATLFRRRIEQGQWKLGGRIPTVDDLAAQYGVARATIRQALGQLEQEGLIERFRAKGTFVRKAIEAPVCCRLETDWNGLLQSHEGAEIEILSDADGVPGGLVPGGAGTPAPRYRHIRRRHSHAGQPFMVSDIYLDARLAALVSEADLRCKSALRLLADLEQAGVADARQVLTVGTADVETAEALGVALNAPVVHAHRAVLDTAGGLVMVTDAIYRGDAVRIDNRLR